MGWLTAARWSPYAVGIGIGILSWLTWLISSKPLGCSTTFARTAGMIERALLGKRTTQKLYYQEVKPIVDWQYMLVVGIVIGALVSALLSGDFELVWIPSLWAAAFGNGVGLRLIVALVGGVLLGFGARWADGCTSGHGIGGTMQLAVSSWISSVCFFVGGIIAAFALYRWIA